MKSRSILLLIALALAPAPAAFAKGKVHAPTPHARKRTGANSKNAPTTRPPTIFSIEGQAISVKIDRVARQYKVTPATVITLNGAKAPLSALKSGMQVSVQTEASTGVAKTITATSYHGGQFQTVPDRTAKPTVAAPRPTRQQKDFN